ncbi:MAG: thioredoxin-disulfide reductase [Halanaerobiales bacterium]
MSDNIKKEKLIIIGGGPAGLTSAIYSARAGLEPLVMNGPEPGGQITLTPDLENYPGFPDGVGGFELMEKVTEQAQKFGTRMAFEIVERVQFEEKPYMIETDTQKYQAESVIIATGSESKRLGLYREEELTGNGISYCATCDGAFFKGKEVAVVGGGNVAIEEADFLTKFASKVYLIHRRDKLRGDQILADRIKENDKVEILWSTEVKELKGDNNLSGIVIENSERDEIKILEDVKGLFMAVGYDPRTDIFKGQIELDQKNYIITDNKQRTNKEGIFAAGDVQEPNFNQVIVAAGTGAKAAMQVDKYLIGY